MMGGPEAQAAASPAHEREARSTLTAGRWMTPIIVAVVVLDQVTKALVNTQLPVHASVNVIPGLLDLTHVRNTGAAFGLLNAVDFPFKPAVMTIIASLALVAIAVYTTRIAPRGWVVRIGLALVLGGAVGNLIDRLFAGYVIDFVDVYWREYHFWAFNVADSAITVGAALMILDMLALEPHVSDPL